MVKSANFRRRRNPTSKLNIIKIIAIVLLLAATVFLVLAFNTKLLRVNQILLNPKKLSCANEEDFKKALEVLGKNIFFLDQPKIYQQVSRKFYCIENINLNRKFPNTLEVKINERKGVAVLNILKNNLDALDLIEASPSSQTAKLDFSVNDASISGAFIVDALGFVFAKIEDANFQNLSHLPQVYVSNVDVKLGQITRSSLVKIILDTLNKLSLWQVPIFSLKVDGNKVLLNGETKIVLSLDRDYRKQLASLQLILEKAKISSNSKDSKKMEFIDLRFDKPIIIYSPIKK